MNEKQQIGKAENFGDMKGRAVIMRPPEDVEEKEEVKGVQAKAVSVGESIVLDVDPEINNGETRITFDSNDIDSLLKLAAMTHIVHKTNYVKQIESVALLNLLFVKAKGNFKIAIQDRLKELQ